MSAPHRGQCGPLDTGCGRLQSWRGRAPTRHQGSSRANGNGHLNPLKHPKSGERQVPAGRPGADAAGHPQGRRKSLPGRASRCGRRSGHRRSLLGSQAASRQLPASPARLTGRAPDHTGIVTEAGEAGGQGESAAWALPGLQAEPGREPQGQAGPALDHWGCQARYGKARQPLVTSRQEPPSEAGQREGVVMAKWGPPKLTY